MQPRDRRRRPAEPDYAELQRKLARGVARACPHWLRSHRDDLVQNALMRVVRAVRGGEVRQPGSTSYLMKVAYSVTLDEIRRVTRKREEAMQPEDETNLPGDRGDPERTGLSAELGEAIRECLGRLVRPRRVAVTLYLMGHSGPDSSRILGWDKKRVNNLVYRGLADLRRCLESKGITP